MALPGKTSALHQIRQLSEVEGTSWGRTERVHFMPALDPIQCAPVTLAKDRRCKSSTG
jgi:hypothetical protein